jgi:hypothetical protein
MRNFRRLSATAFSTAVLLAPLSADAQAADKWDFGAAIYVYLPTIGAKTTFPPSGSGSGVSVDADTILENLKMTFMGTLEASNGTWGVLTDLVYVDVGNSKSGTQAISIGRVGIPAGASANVDYDLKGWVWGLVGTHRLVSDADFRVEALAGARVLDIRQKVNWNLSGNVGSIALQDRSGTRELDGQNWDAIVGMRGRARFAGSGWFIPYYIDIGTGQSKFTWQAMAGVGYSFGWGDVLAAWRYIDYQMKSGEPIESVNFNGPGIAAVFRW